MIWSCTLRINHQLHYATVPFIAPQAKLCPTADLAQLNIVRTEEATCEHVIGRTNTKKFHPSRPNCLSQQLASERLWAHHRRARAFTTQTTRRIGVTLTTGIPADIGILGQKEEEVQTRKTQLNQSQWHNL
jgi:hypothetical protein